MILTSRSPVPCRAIFCALALGLAAIALLAAEPALAQGRGQGFGQGQGQGGQRPMSEEQREKMRQQMREQMLQQQQQEQQPQPGAATQAPAPMMRQETVTSADELLDPALLADPARREEAKTKAAVPPPAGADDSTLARFYFDRAKEADIAGLATQHLHDLRKAAEHGEKSKVASLAQIYYHLAQAEQQHGHMIVAIRAVEKAIEYLAHNQRGRIIAFYALLGRYAAVTGDLPTAEKTLVQAENAYIEMQRNIQRNRSRAANLTPEALAVFQAQLLCAQASLNALRGQQAAAEDFWRKCLATAQKTPHFNGTPFIGSRHLELAFLLMSQGRLDDAENEARQGLLFFQRLRGASGPLTAQALSILSVVLAEQGRTIEAEQLARKAIELVRSSGLKGQGPIRMALANTLAAQGTWAEAAAQIETFRRAAAADPNLFNNATKRNAWLPLILIKSGKAAEATKILTELAAHRQKALGERHFATAEARGQLGLALLETGDRDGARKAFNEAMPVLMQRSREIDDDSGVAGRDARIRLIFEAYIRLLSGDKTPQAAAEAFRIAEAARGRTVERALAASAARMAADNPQLAELARREQDVQQQVSGLNSLLANAISAKAEDQNAEAIKGLRAQIDGLRDQRAQVVEEIEKKFPDYAGLTNPKPATVELAQNSLKPGEALLSIYSAEDATYVWTVPQQGASAFAQWKIARGKLDKSVAALRKALDPNAQTLDDIPAFDVAAAHRIYANLLKPVEAGWGQAKSLVIVPHGALAQLPFALLPTQAAAVEKTPVPFKGYAAVPWLARKVSIAQLPSVASLATLRALPAGDAKRSPFIGFADPWFNAEQAAEAGKTQTAQLATRGANALNRRSAPKSVEAQAVEFKMLPRLPDTADEVRSIAQALKADAAKSVFLGAQANKGTVRRQNLAGYKIVMFATHGLTPGEIVGLSQPALALSGPDVSPDGGNGLLTMEEILSLKLNADWVVLSACNTATGQGAGSEAVSGLGRAFFYAGTRALLVSNWPVETVSARTLTTDLFRRQAETKGLSRAEALRQAMMALVDGPGSVDPSTRQPIFSYAHPIFWAAFSLVGDGGA